MSDSTDKGGPHGSLRAFPDKGYICGVCAGLAYWLGWPTWTIRTIVLLMLFMPKVGGAALVAYLLLWVFLPSAETPADFHDVTG